MIFVLKKFFWLLCRKEVLEEGIRVNRRRFLRNIYVGNDSSLNKEDVLIL